MGLVVLVLVLDSLGSCHGWDLYDSWDLWD
jgi:hypothetical protein